MKSKKSLLAMLTILHFAMSAQKSMVSSNVKEATVYLNGAFVVREARTSLFQGSNTLVFSKIPASIEPSSIQISVDKNIEIISVRTREKIKSNPDDSILLLKLTDSLNSLRKSRVINDTKLKVLKEEEDIIRKNQPSFSSEYAIKTTELQSVVLFNRTRLSELFFAMVELNYDSGRLDSLEKLLKLRIARIRNTKPEKWYDIETEVTSTGRYEATFRISYFTMFASWLPSYDLRVQDVSSPVRLQMKASLTQFTGETWENVRLTVSNGSPENSEVGPGIAPWFLRYFQRTDIVHNANTTHSEQIRNVSGVVRDNAGEPLIGANVFIKEYSSVGVVTDIEGRYYIPVPQGSKTITVSYVGYVSKESSIKSDHVDFILDESNLLEEVVITGSRVSKENSNVSYAINGINTKELVVRDFAAPPAKVSYQPTTFSFTIDKPCTVNSSSVGSDIMVNMQEIPSVYHYWTIPKMEKSVFLTARLADWQKFDLLSGQINLYLEGKYVGKSFLDVRVAADTLDISLGRDKNIIVERTMTRDFRKKNFMSNKTTIEKKFAFEVRNNKGQPVRVTVQDHFPISTDKSIDVYDTEAPKGIINTENKIVTWLCDLQPRSSVSFDLSYSVKFSADKWVDLE